MGCQWQLFVDHRLGPPWTLCLSITDPTTAAEFWQLLGTALAADIGLRAGRRRGAHHSERLTRSQAERALLMRDVDAGRAQVRFDQGVQSGDGGSLVFPVVVDQSVPGGGV